MESFFVFLLAFGEMDLSITTVVILILLTGFTFISVIISSLSLFKSSFEEGD
tara:strand:+ start:1253 stop:1408 length:156 start_codon:yes stop_codon:yes gene_type:complete